jgi:hypothetical protein
MPNNMPMGCQEKKRLIKFKKEVMKKKTPTMELKRTDFKKILV